MGHSVSGAGVAAPSGQGVSLSAGGNVLIARGSWGRRVGECGVGGGAAASAAQDKDSVLSRPVEQNRNKVT